MTITGPSSYPATVDEFVAHWTQANAELGATDVVLAGGTTLANFSGIGEDLLAKRDEVQSALNAREIGRGNVNVMKTALNDRLVQFNEKIRAFFPDSKWLNALPSVPTFSAAQSRFVDPLADANDLWSRINADPDTGDPVTLLGGYTQTTFGSDIEVLKEAYGVLNKADTDLTVTRGERNQLQDQLYEMMKSYRLALPTFFAKDNPLVETLPRLTPLPGHTPDPVTVSGAWDPATELANLSWTASDDPDLERYEVRMSPGATYSTEDDSVIGSVEAGGPLEFSTNAGLTSPGLNASFRVYVMLTTGNERGSTTLPITRPISE